MLYGAIMLRRVSIHIWCIRDCPLLGGGQGLSLENPNLGGSVGYEGRAFPRAQWLSNFIRHPNHLGGLWKYRLPGPTHSFWFWGEGWEFACLTNSLRMLMMAVTQDCTLRTCSNSCVVPSLWRGSLSSPLLFRTMELLLFFKFLTKTMAQYTQHETYRLHHF